MPPPARSRAPGQSSFERVGGRSRTGSRASSDVSDLSIQPFGLIAIPMIWALAPINVLSFSSSLMVVINLSCRPAITDSGQSSVPPTPDDLEVAKHQGARVAQVAAALKAGG